MSARSVTKTPQEIDEEIIYWHAKGFSIRGIAQRTHTGSHRILDVIAAHKQGLFLSHTRGAPRKVTQEVEDWVVSVTVDNPSISSAELSRQIQVQTGVIIGPDTVRNIRHRCNFRWAKAKKCPLLTYEHICARIQFAMDYEGDLFRELRGLPFVFSDESRFCCGSDNHWVWKRKNEFRYSILAPRDKFPKFSIMVWGAIGVNFKSTLIIFDTNVNAKTYIESLKNGFFEEAHRAYNGRPWVLVQDGATCHTTPSNLDELTKSCILCPSWPANSPDLNPIEMLWGIIKSKLNWESVHTRVDAIREIRNHWNDIPMTVINSLCVSFPARIEMMRAANGETIQPLLSSNLKCVPLGYLPDRLTIVPQAPWTAEADAFLISKSNELKCAHWDRIALFFPGRTGCSVKNRWKVLRTQELNKENEEARMGSIQSFLTLP
jgi:transposase